MKTDSAPTDRRLYLWLRGMSRDLYRGKGHDKTRREKTLTIRNRSVSIKTLTPSSVDPIYGWAQ